MSAHTYQSATDRLGTILEAALKQICEDNALEPVRLRRCFCCWVRAACEYDAAAVQTRAERAAARRASEPALTPELT